LEVTGYFINPNIDYTPDDKGRMNTFSSYPYAAVIAVVDVDVETGMIKIVKYFTVHDCGNMINPQIVDTQQQGSIMQGIGDFPYRSEQYYMHVDPANEVLATTTFDGTHCDWAKGSTVPVVWKKHYGRGRVFFCALGHTADEFASPQFSTIVERGLLWAAR